MDITLHTAAQRLLDADHILILSHRSPDGDTLGCASALLRGLHSLGKKARFLCSDPVPKKFAFLFEGVEEQDFEPEFIVSVDIADRQLFGKNLEGYAEKVDLCLDHHGTNGDFAKERYVEPKAAAACEVLFLLLKEMQVTISPEIADCLFTGISTDTGCFRFGNVTPRTHRMGAELMELGAHAAEINRQMYDTKSRARLEVEKYVLQSMTFHFDGKCAVLCLPISLVEELSVEEGDLDGVASMSRQVEGVMVGVTIREKEDGMLKVSLRTNPPVDAAEICGEFGGGGHAAAAGCSFTGKSFDEVKVLLLEAVQKQMERCGL